MHMYISDRRAAEGTLKKLVPHKWNLDNPSFHPTRCVCVCVCVCVKECMCIRVCV